MPSSILVLAIEYKRVEKLTGILGVFWADIIIAGVQNVLIHECRARRDLSEERNLDWLANLDSLALLDEDLASIFAAILAIQRRDTILFGVVTLLEGLESSHEIMSTSDTVSNDTLSDTGGDGTLDDGGHRVHGADDLGLELRWHVKLDLLEEVF